jgi:cell division protein FtsW
VDCPDISGRDSGPLRRQYAAFFQAICTHLYSTDCSRGPDYHAGFRDGGLYRPADVFNAVGGSVWWHFLAPLPILVLGFIAAIISSPTRIKRIQDFLNSEISYQAGQSLRAIATGGIFGKGLGMGVFKYGHLPEDTTDFIFSVVAEETGFVGATIIILLFVLFMIIGLKAVSRCQDRFGRLLGYGIVLCITIQAAVNIGVVTVVLPTKGIPLPLISAGGTSMLLTAAAMGILLNILRHTQECLTPTNMSVFLTHD